MIRISKYYAIVEKLRHPAGIGLGAALGPPWDLGCCQGLSLGPGHCPSKTWKSTGRCVGGGETRGVGRRCEGLLETPEPIPVETEFRE